MGQRGLGPYALVKHINTERLALVLDGLKPAMTGRAPGMPERRLESRCAVLERLQGAHAESALRYVLDHLEDGWAEAHLAKLIYVMVRLGQAVGMPGEAAPKMLVLANHANDDVRTEAVWFLANHSPRAHHALLLQKLDDPYPRVLDAIFNGLAVNADVPPDLLRRAAAIGLGNYSGHDGEPHYSAMTMVKASAANAQTALPELTAWWEAASAAKYLERNTIEEALGIADLLGAAAAPLKGGFQRALAYLTAPEEEAEELPAINEPGAIPLIQAKLEAGMLQAGNPPEVVAAAGEFYGGLMEYLADNTATWQKQIDERQARSDAEMRELYPELYAEREEAEDEAEHAPQEYEDELVVRLRATIAKFA